MDELRENIKQVRSLNKSVNSLLTSKALNEIMALIDSYAEKEVEKEQTLHLSDVSRAVGLLDGLGHPDAYLEERRAELLKSLGGKDNE